MVGVAAASVSRSATLCRIPDSSRSSESRSVRSRSNVGPGGGQRSCSFERRRAVAAVDRETCCTRASMPSRDASLRSRFEVTRSDPQGRAARIAAAFRREVGVLGAKAADLGLRPPAGHTKPGGRHERQEHKRRYRRTDGHGPTADLTGLPIGDDYCGSASIACTIPDVQRKPG